MYKSEEILRILLDTNLDKRKISHERPTQINKSATFIVDLDSLKQPDDVKKDDFGKWNYSGSHVQTYLIWHNDNNDIEVNKVDSSSITMSENVVQLRRIHCKHPSNSQFQKLMAFVTVTFLLNAIFIKFYR